MEQHPIPQDITGFKFKLVGDMTLQQFGYLAGGSILAYISFTLRVSFLIKWPLVFFFALGGIALAFLPFEERPLDRWLTAFFKAVYSPTQYLWKKKGVLPSFFETTYLSAVNTSSPIITAYENDKQRLETYLKTLPPTSSLKIDVLEETFLQSLDSISLRKVPVIPTTKPPVQEEVKPTSPQPAKIPEEKPFTPRPFAIIGGRIVKQEVPVSPLPPRPWEKPKKKTPDPLGKLKEQNELLEKKATDLKSEMGKLKESPVFTVEDLNKLKNFAQRLVEVEGQRNKAQAELEKLRLQLEQTKKSGVTPMTEEFQIKQTPRVKFVAGNITKRVGLPNPPQTPNILSGLVIDQKGEILPGVIVVVKDNEDNPVRAIKTNKLGQFSISTPLPNGVYSLELEKEGYEFDIIEIEAKGEIILPIEIKAK